MNDLVSIIMLSRDKEQFLEASVRSVMAQTYQNWELLFVDDASKDDSISVLMKLNWRYWTYRKIECMNPLQAAYMTVRNMAYAALKWRKYKER